jgi:exonuclease SbcD
LLEEIVSKGLEDERRDDFILARLTDHGAILDSMGKLRSAYPNALSIERIENEAGSGIANANDHRKIGTDALFASFYKEMTGLELENEALDMLNTQITSIENTSREITQ